MDSITQRLRHINWKLAVARVVVNGVAIALTVAVLPGLTVENAHVATFLLMGLAYGLLNAFVRPIIQFLTLSFLFVTYGLVIIVINSVMLVLLGLLFPELKVTTGIIGIVLGGTLLAFFGLFLESVFGLTPPLIDDSGEIKDVGVDQDVDLPPPSRPTRPDSTALDPGADL